MSTPDVRIIFGKAVRKHRGEARLSQEELATRSGIHRTYIGGIERGERNPTLLMIVRIARALGATPATLLEDLPIAESAPSEDDI